MSTYVSSGVWSEQSESSSWTKPCTSGGALADMLRHLLDAKGVSQAELHRETGISKSSISEVLSGKKSLSRPMMRKLIRLGHVDLSRRRPLSFPGPQRRYSFTT